ncbi:unnamed protein product [Prorocentrum cordatum]|uniref:Uncharacterized protein n=1 Tax=Prorocentrum cordatum TaxID=2364126 RepID=A0ABN9UXB6_9DINO|nr:unnamed protein product [Polarella glacialis]
MGSTLVTPGAREAGRADLPGFPPWAPSPAAAPADSWWHHRLCSAPEPAPEELVGGGVEPRVPQPGPALSEPASPPPKVTPSTPAGSRLTPPQRAQSRRSPSVMVKRSTTQTTVSRMRSSTHEPSTSSSRSSPNASCSSRLARMARRVEAAAVEKFLQEHRFSGIDHCRRAGRWPLSRRCCPLSLAAQRGDVSTVILLLKQGADPLLPLTLLRRQQATGAWQQDARRLLERAAGETGRGLAAESGALWSIFHVVDPWAESGRSRCSASWSAAIPCCAGLGRGRPDRRRAGGGTIYEEHSRILGCLFYSSKQSATFAPKLRLEEDVPDLQVPMPVPLCSERSGGSPDLSGGAVRRQSLGAKPAAAARAPPRRPRRAGTAEGRRHRCAFSSRETGRRGRAECGPVRAGAFQGRPPYAQRRRRGPHEAGGAGVCFGIARTCAFFLRQRPSRKKRGISFSATARERRKRCPYRHPCLVVFAFPGLPEVPRRHRWIRLGPTLGEVWE